MNVLIIGCGRVGAQLATILSQEEHNVTIIDENKDAFKNLGATFNGLTITGDGCNEALLKEVNAGKMDALVAVTSTDTANLMASQIAKKIFNIPKVMARVYDPKRANIYRTLGIDIISGIRIVAAMIRDKIIENRFTSYLIESPDIGVLEVEVGKKLEGMKVGDLNIRSEFIITALVREKKVLLPDNETVAAKGDKLLGVVKLTALGKVKEILGIS